MAIQLEKYEKIRYLYEQEGMSQRNIARQLSISRNTVKKYFDGSSVPWVGQEISGQNRTVISVEVKEFVKSCLEEDEKENFKKQKHTAKRIYDCLAEEKDFSGGESTIRELVASPLSFEPGEAIQVDWGEATIYLNAHAAAMIFFARYFTDKMKEAFWKDKSMDLALMQKCRIDMQL